MDTGHFLVPVAMTKKLKLLMSSELIMDGLDAVPPIAVYVPPCAELLPMRSSTLSAAIRVRETFPVSVPELRTARQYSV